MESKWLPSIFSKEIYIHILFWLMYVLYPLLSLRGQVFMWQQWGARIASVPVGILFCYGCYFYFFKKKIKFKGIKFLLFLLLILVAGVFSTEFILRSLIYQIENFSYWVVISSIVSEYLFLFLIFYGWYTFKKNYQLETESRKAELRSLKSQINPHFLFNSLNSIYSFILEKDPKAEAAVLKLADVFKYVLNEGQHDKVALTQDIAHIDDFLEIHTMRWEDKFAIDFIKEIDNYQVTIPPLLIITFIENAIKYTSKMTGNLHKIEIRYKVNNRVLSFTCRNPYNPTSALSATWEGAGIGLENVKQRLALLYPDRHRLSILQEDNFFTVTLNIDPL